MSRRTNTAAWDEKNKRWKINVQRDGVRRSFYSSTPGRAGQREANGKADAWLDGGISNDNKRVADLYAEFLASKRESTCKSNADGIEYRYRDFIGPVIGKKRLYAVTEVDLQSCINKAYKSRNLSAKSLKSIRGDLTAFMKFCRLKKATTLYPESLTIPASAKRSVKRILQPDDLVKLFDSDRVKLRGKECTEEYIHAFRVAVLTGMRPGEMIGLEWADITGNQVHISRSVNIHGETTQGKNRNAIRTVILSDLALQEIEAQRLITGGAKTVFEIPSTGTLYKHWKRYCECNDIEPISLYEMRHTFVSVAQNLPEGLVKKVVGHSQSMDTWGVYAHVMDGQQEATAQKIGDVFDVILNRDS